MKKLVLASIIACTTVAAATAQKKVSLGPIVSLGGSAITGTYTAKFKPSGAIGASMVYSSSKHFGIGLDAKYSFEGEKYNTSGITGTANLNYVRIPLKAIYFFNSHNEKIKPKVFAGPSFGFLVGGKERIQAEGIKTVTKSQDRYKSFDAGMAAGGGLNYKLKEDTWLGADLSYYRGLTNILPGNSESANNHNLAINVSVLFGL